MRLPLSRTTWVVILALMITGVALVGAVHWWTRPRAETPDLRAQIVSQLGLDSVLARHFELNVPLTLTRAPGTVIATDSKDLLSAGRPDSSTLHRSGMSSLVIDLSDLHRGGGKLGIPLLGIAVSGSDQYDLRLTLDSAQVVEMTDGDLQAYVRNAGLAALERRDRAAVVRRVVEASVSLTMTRGDTAAHGVWVRDSAAVAEGIRRSGGRLDLDRSSSRRLVFNSARTVVLFQAVPLCVLADCKASAGADRPDTPAITPRRAREATAGERPMRRSTARHPVHVFVSPHNARLRVDSVDYGSGHRTLLLPSGVHVIEASLPGFLDGRELAEIEGETTITIELARP